LFNSHGRNNQKVCIPIEKKTWKHPNLRQIKKIMNKQTPHPSTSIPDWWVGARSGR
jgi:hypothetical protein